MIHPLRPAQREALLPLINAYTAGWPYSRPVDDALLDHWATLGALYQPERLWLASPDGRPRAFVHGELDGDTWFVHLLALEPGAVAEAVALLQRVEQQARQAGAARLCGPNWRSGLFYGSYLLGGEPYHPHWAVEATTAYVQAGWRISHPAVILRLRLDAPAAPRPLPPPYVLAEVEAPPEFDARTMRFQAALDGEEAATCTARVYPGLPAAGGGAVGQVGSVGTGEAHRGKGLAKVLVAHCLQRLHAWGAGEVLIATGLDNAPALRAYEAVGFRRCCNINEWSKELTGTPA